MREYKKSKKRGVTLLELSIVVAMIAIFVSMLGPVLRYYIRLSSNYNNRVYEKIELVPVFSKLEDLVGSITVTDQNSQSRNSGTAVRTYTAPIDLSISLTKIKGEIMKPNGKNEEKIVGNTLFILIPTMSSDGKKLVEVYHVFRFLKDASGNGILYYSNNLDSNGNPIEMSKGGTNLTFDEEEYLPTGSGMSKLLVNGVVESRFVEVDGGVIIHLEYLDNAGKKQIVEKLFLKRGEV